MDRALFDIRRAGVCYAARTAKLLERWQFTHSRVDIFMIHAQVIARHGVVFQCDIRARLGVSRSTMTVMMARLERRGFIERRRSEYDRRKIVVAITELGRRAFGELRDRVGPDLFTPDVNTRLTFHDFKTPLPIKRGRLLELVSVVRAQFGDFSSGPYPP